MISSQKARRGGFLEGVSSHIDVHLVYLGTFAKKIFDQGPRNSHCTQQIARKLRSEFA